MRRMLEEFGVLPELFGRVVVPEALAHARLK
jgi:hypothetical protein